MPWFGIGARGAPLPQLPSTLRRHGRAWRGEPRESVTRQIFYRKLLPCCQRSRTEGTQGNPFTGTRPLSLGKSGCCTLASPLSCAASLLLNRLSPNRESCSLTKDPFCSVPISPKLPEELKLPCAEKLPLL